MSKPTIASGAWATDANIASGTETGTPTKVDPGAGYRAQGWVPGLRMVGPYDNYWRNQMYLWAQYVDNLPAEAAFNGADFTWTGQHKYTSVFGATDPQLSAARNVSRIVPFSNFQGLIRPLSGATWQWIPGGSVSYISTSTNVDVVYCDLSSVFPDSAVLSKVRVVVDPGTGQTGTNRMSFRLMKYTHNTAAVADNVQTVIDVVGDDASHYVYATASTSSRHLVDLAPTTTETSDNGGNYVLTAPGTPSNYVLECISSVGASGTQDLIQGVYIEYTETFLNRNW